MSDDLVERIGAEFDRRLDAKLAALDLTGEKPHGLHAGHSPRHATDMRRSSRHSLWLGIVIGSVVCGTAAVVVGATLSDAVATSGILSYMTGERTFLPSSYASAAGDMLTAVGLVWALLLVSFVARGVADRARAQRRPR